MTLNLLGGSSLSQSNKLLAFAVHLAVNGNKFMFDSYCILYNLHFHNAKISPRASALYLGVYMYLLHLQIPDWKSFSMLLLPCKYSINLKASRIFQYNYIIQSSYYTFCTIYLQCIVTYICFTVVSWMKA